MHSDAEDAKRKPTNLAQAVLRRSLEKSFLKHKVTHHWDQCSPALLDTAHPEGSEKLLVIPSIALVKIQSPHQLPEQLAIFTEQPKINQVSKFP